MYCGAVRASHSSMPGFGRSRKSRKSELFMKTSRREDDERTEPPEKMSPFTRINTEFGAWSPLSTTTPRITARSSDMTLDTDEIPTATSAPNLPTNASTIRPSFKSSKPRAFCRHFTPRYSKFDTFIDHLDAACKALPTPLVGSASATCSPPPPASRATPMKGLSSPPSTDDARHPPQHAARKTPQPQDQNRDAPRPLSSPGAIVKEVKFADEVVEIGASRDTVPAGAGAEPEAEPEVMAPKANALGVESQPPRRRGSANLAGASPSPPPPPPPRRRRPPPPPPPLPLPPRVAPRGLRLDRREKRDDAVRADTARAATVLQSTYRGYRLRRGQTLRHMLAVGGVEQKLQELRQQFDAWKIAAWFPTDLTERVTMTESVMHLLLQLDSLQGVPVVVREYRKKVARDVIKFQGEVDAFLFRNSKHGVLFDLTQPEAKATTEESSDLKPSKTIRNIVVQEPKNKYDGNLPQSDFKSSNSGHDGSWKENAGVTPGPESVGQSKINGVRLYCVEPHCCTRRDFEISPPGDAKPPNVAVEEQSCEGKELENVTEQRKCVASTGNLTMNVPSGRKKKSLKVRFGTVNSGNISARSECVSTDDECLNAPPENNTTPLNSTDDVESLMKDRHHPPDVLSWEPTRNFQRKDDSQWKVSINKERSLHPYPNGRIQFSNDDRNAEVHEDLLEDCEIRYPQTNIRPQTPAQSHYPLTEMWDAEFPADPHLDSSIEIHTSYTSKEKDKDLEMRSGSPDLAHPDCLLREKREDPPDFRSNNRIEIDKTCTGMETTPVVISEPNAAKVENLHIPAEEVIREHRPDEHLRPSMTTSQAFSSRVELASAKDVREGIIQPLLASDGDDSDLDCPVRVSQLDHSSKDTTEIFDGYKHIGSSVRNSEGNRLGMPNAVDAKEGDTCSVVALTEGREKFVEAPGTEAVGVGQSTLMNSFEHSLLLNGNSCEQLDGSSENEYDPCAFDDLETISSCSNCAADCTGESWEMKSGIHELVQHQPYALKGLVREADEAFSEFTGGDKCLEVGRWKDEAWSDYRTAECRPYNITTVTTEPDLDKEVELEREDGSCKSYKTVESDKVQYFGRPEPNLIFPHEEDYQGIKQVACPESKGSNLDCTSPSSGDRAVASGSTASVSHDTENNILSKLVEDNKRLKELLKEVMKWNTVQANAMITLNERLELIERNN